MPFCGSYQEAEAAIIAEQGMERLVLGMQPHVGATSRARLSGTR